MDVLGVASLVSKVIDKVVPDKDAALAAKQKLLELQQAGELAVLASETDVIKGQLAINAAEAANPSVFVAGWRPFIGWTCGTAFSLHFVVFPMGEYLGAITGHPFAPPAFDMTALLNVTLGMLGMAGWRTLEKVRGIK